MLSLVQPSLAVQSSLALCAASQLPIHPRFQPAEYIMEHCQDFVDVSGELSIPSHAMTIEQLRVNAEKLLEKRAKPIPSYVRLAPVFFIIAPLGMSAASAYRDYGTLFPEGVSPIPPIVKTLIIGSIAGGIMFVASRLEIRNSVNKAEQALNDYLDTIPKETLSLIAVELAKLRGDDDLNGDNGGLTFAGEHSPGSTPRELPPDK